METGFSQNFYVRKLDEITAFYAVCSGFQYSTVQQNVKIPVSIEINRSNGTKWLSIV